MRSLCRGSSPYGHDQNRMELLEGRFLRAGVYVDSKTMNWTLTQPQLLCPLAADVLFTVGILVVSNVFPERTQALAGAVFNTVAQLGTSIGLAATAVISSTVTRDSDFSNKNSPAALMTGYRATFWTLFAWMITACLVGGFGLRKLGKIGQKTE